MIGQTLSLGYGTALAAAVTALRPVARFLIYGASFGVVDAVERTAVAGPRGIQPRTDRTTRLSG